MMTVETKRLILRPLYKEDGLNTVDPGIKEAAACFGGMPRCFAVVDKDAEIPIGYVVIQKGDLSFYITPQKRGQGYAFEALCLSFDLLFGCEGMQKISAVCAAENRYAIKALYHAGMEKEKEENGRFYGALTAIDWERL
jgi:RimJ/RimL family protein N-acetyltransferase